MLRSAGPINPSDSDRDLVEQQIRSRIVPTSSAPPAAESMVMDIATARTTDMDV
jgi:hypothetical protein